MMRASIWIGAILALASAAPAAAQGMMQHVDLASPDLASVDLARDPAGPWPVKDLVIYSLGSIVDASPDESRSGWRIVKSSSGKGSRACAAFGLPGRSGLPCQL